MTIRVTNGRVIGKIKELAITLGTSETAAVEAAVDSLLAKARRDHDSKSNAVRIDAILAQIDRIPDRPDAYDPLRWDTNGLPS